MRKIMLFAVVSLFLGLPVLAAAQGKGHAPTEHGNTSLDKDAHGDAVSAAAKDAKADGDKVGADVRDTARDKANGKGLSKTHGKGH